MEKKERPSWDRYFMNIAHVVASRSNCSRRQVAAVIVKDQRIISTGYNGTPRGVKNCNDGGCPRCADHDTLMDYLSYRSVRASVDELKQRRVYPQAPLHQRPSFQVFARPQTL